MSKIECKGYYGTDRYTEPHTTDGKYSVVVNDENYVNWEMCRTCYFNYLNDQSLERMLKEFGETVEADDEQETTIEGIKEDK